MGTVKGFEAKLVRKDTTPTLYKARLVLFPLRPKVEAEIDCLLEAGILSKVDRSEWATPVVPTVKKDSSVTQSCRWINIPFLMSRISSQQWLEDNTQQDRLEASILAAPCESNKPYLTINTHKGLNRYNWLAFGIAMAPAIWQHTMDQILQGIPETQCLLDDMIITGRTDEEHLTKLESVLNRLGKYGLGANPQNCEFFKERIQFCGTAGSLAADQHNGETKDQTGANLIKDVWIYYDGLAGHIQQGGSTLLTWKGGNNRTSGMLVVGHGEWMNNSEKMTKNSSGCLKTRHMPAPVPVPLWEWPTDPWQRIYVDYTGPLEEQSFLVVIDAHLKVARSFLHQVSDVSSNH